MVGASGLEYDRSWAIVLNSDGSALNQKREPKLCLIRPTIDLEGYYLHVDAPNMDRLSISLSVDTTSHPPSTDGKPLRIVEGSSSATP